MTGAAEVLSEAGRIGLLLRPEGSRILVRPARALPPALADALRGHREEILELLSARHREGVHGAARASADPNRLRCLDCRGLSFWRGRGVVACRACHAPAPGAEVLP